MERESFVLPSPDKKKGKNKPGKLKLGSVVRANFESSVEKVKRETKELDSALARLTIKPAESAEKKAEKYTPLPNFSLGATEFSGGEVIIDLQGDKPVEERVLPLRPEEDGGSLSAVHAKGHHMEKSVWHSIEIDNKTGSVAENPSFEYGEEFHKEVAAEADNYHRNMAAGEVALVAAASSVKSGSKNDSKVASTLKTTKVIGSTVANGVGKMAQTNTPIWPWAVALVVLIICLVLALK